MSLLTLDRLHSASFASDGGDNSARQLTDSPVGPSATAELNAPSPFTASGRRSPTSTSRKLSTHSNAAAASPSRGGVVFQLPGPLASTGLGPRPGSAVESVVSDFEKPPDIATLGAAAGSSSTDAARMYFHVDYAPKTKSEFAADDDETPAASRHSSTFGKRSHNSMFGAFTTSGHFASGEVFDDPAEGSTAFKPFDIPTVSSPSGLPPATEDVREERPVRHLRPAKIALIEAELEAAAAAAPAGATASSASLSRGDLEPQVSFEPSVTVSPRAASVSPGLPPKSPVSRTRSPRSSAVGFPSKSREAGRSAATSPLPAGAHGEDSRSSGTATPTAGKHSGSTVGASGRFVARSTTLLRPRGWSLTGDPHPMPSTEQLSADIRAKDTSIAVNLLTAPKAEREKARMGLVPGAASAAAARATAKVTDPGQAMHFRAIRARHALVEAEESMRESERHARDEAGLDRLRDVLQGQARDGVDAGNLQRPRPSLALLQRVESLAAPLAPEGSNRSGAVTDVGLAGQTDAELRIARRRTTVGVVPRDAEAAAARAALFSVISDDANPVTFDARPPLGRDHATAASSDQPPARGTDRRMLSALHRRMAAQNSSFGASAVSSSGGASSTLLQTSFTDHGSTDGRSFESSVHERRSSHNSRANGAARVQALLDAGMGGTRIRDKRVVEGIVAEETQLRSLVDRDERRDFNGALCKPYLEFHDAVVVLLRLLEDYEVQFGVAYVPWDAYGEDQLDEANDNSDNADGPSDGRQASSSDALAPFSMRGTPMGGGSGFEGSSSRAVLRTPGGRGLSTFAVSSPPPSAMSSIRMTAEEREELPGLAAIAAATQRLELPDAGGAPPGAFGRGGREPVHRPLDKRRTGGDKSSRKRVVGVFTPGAMSRQQLEQKKAALVQAAINDNQRSLQRVKGRASRSASSGVGALHAAAVDVADMLDEFDEMDQVVEEQGRQAKEECERKAKIDEAFASVTFGRRLPSASTAKSRASIMSGSGGGLIDDVAFVTSARVEDGFGSTMLASVSTAAGTAPGHTVAFASSSQRHSLGDGGHDGDSPTGGGDADGGEKLRSALESFNAFGTFGGGSAEDDAFGASSSAATSRGDGGPFGGGGGGGGGGFLLGTRRSLGDSSSCGSSTHTGTASVVEPMRVLTRREQAVATWISGGGRARYIARLEARITVDQQFLKLLHYIAAQTERLSM